MKWPLTLTLVRHDESQYNFFKENLQKSELYKKLKNLQEENPDSKELKKIALKLFKQANILTGDHNMDLSENSGWRAEQTIQQLKLQMKLPDVIFISPYDRTKLTLKYLIKGWKELEKVPVIADHRIREQDHGIMTIYGDKTIYHALEPLQKKLYQLEGKYYYRFPQGENIPDVQTRCSLWINKLIRDWAGKNVLVISHNVFILALRLNIENLSDEDFLVIDNLENSINCGVTQYEGNPQLGNEGRLVLKYYNKKLY